MATTIPPSRKSKRLQYSLKLLALFMGILSFVSWQSSIALHHQTAIAILRANGYKIVVARSLSWQPVDWLVVLQLLPPECGGDVVSISQTYPMNHESIESLAQLKVLRRVDSILIRNVADNERAWVYIGSCPRLRVLKVNMCRLTQDNVRDLSQCGTLERLDLENAKLVEGAIMPLAKATSLRWLRLGESFPVSDASSLSKITSLSELDITLTNVRGEDIQFLKESLPNCTVILGVPVQGEVR